MFSRSKRVCDEPNTSTALPVTTCHRMPSIIQATYRQPARTIELHQNEHSTVLRKGRLDRPDCAADHKDTASVDDAFGPRSNERLKLTGGPYRRVASIEGSVVLRV